MIRRLQAFGVAIIIWHVLSLWVSSPLFPTPVDCAKAAFDRLDNRHRVSFSGYLEFSSDKPLELILLDSQQGEDRIASFVFNPETEDESPWKNDSMGSNWSINLDSASLEWDKSRSGSNSDKHEARFFIELTEGDYPSLMGKYSRDIWLESRQDNLVIAPREKGKAAGACEPNCLVNTAGASLKRVGIGYLAAAFCGLILGAIAGTGRRIGDAFRDVLEMLRPIPPIAWVPLAIVAFQSSEQSAWFIVFVGAFFPIFIQVCHAFANCPIKYLEVAKAYGASPWVTFWWVRVPAAGPEIAQGLRVGLGLAWTSVIAAELVGVKSGLGNQLLNHSIDLYFADLFVCMIAIGLLGWLMTFFANSLERRLITWRQASE